MHIRIWLCGLLALVCACLTLPNAEVEAAGVVVHVGQAGVQVRVADVTKAYWAQAPKSEAEANALQKHLAQQPDQATVATATSNAAGDVELDLPARQNNQQAVYRFAGSGKLATTVALMPADGRGLAVWPKPGRVPTPKPKTPLPETPQPKTPQPGNKTPRPNNKMPLTGEAQALGLTLIGLLLVLIGGLVAHRKLRSV